MDKHLALIIEDDEDLATIFAQALTAADFQTDIIADGRQAMDILNRATPSVVVLDLHLPNVSGAKILQHIRADDRLNETRIILATADSILAETLETEADLVLLKPIGFSQLRDLARRLKPS